MTGPGVNGLRDVDTVRFAADGSVPAVVQDAADGRVLMVAWMDREALEATLRTGEVHFHSRSRGRLWRKGETSGHVLHARSVEPDCDSDTLLVTVDPVGPTCHRGTRSCFDDPTHEAAAAEGAPPDTRSPDDPPGLLAEGATVGRPDRGDAAVDDQGFAWLEVLWETISRRVVERPEGSYTARLVDGGVDTAGRKVTEEATEVLLAARDDAEAQRRGAPRDATSRALAEESADLLYHLLVLTAERGLTPTEILAVLRRRHDPPG